MEKTAPLREYWWIRVAGEPLEAGVRFVDHQQAVEAIGHCRRTESMRATKPRAMVLIHVRVYPKGQHAAWERVVRAACAHMPRHPAVRALGPRRPEGV